MASPLAAEDLAEIAAEPLPFENLSGSAILVTGAAGFLGRHMVEALLHLNATRRLGLEVTALARDRRKAQTVFAAHSGRGALKLLIQDVCDPLPPGRPFDFVVHAASPASPKDFLRDPAATAAPNVIGTHRLLEAARAGGCKRFLFVSSAEVYGDVPAEKLPVRENDGGWLDPVDTRSCYAEAKRMGEALCAAWLRRHAVPAVIARPFHTYGPGLALDDGRVFADFLSDILARRDLVVKGNGSARRMYCYVSDATRALLTILLRGTPGEAYNVGNDEQETSVLELARRVAGLFPDRGLSVKCAVLPGQEGGTGAVDRRVGDVSKLRGLGWTPKHSIESGFLRTIRMSEG